MFVALGTQHANRIFSAQHYIVTCGPSGPTKFSKISSLARFWGEGGKKLRNKINLFRFSLQLFSQKFLILAIIEKEVTINLHRSSRMKYPLFLSDFKETWIFSTVSENPQISISRKSIQWQPSCYVRTHWQTWRSFSQFCERALNSTSCPHTVFMCSVWISEQTAIIPLHSINWLVLITEMQSVYFSLIWYCSNNTLH